MDLFSATVLLFLIMDPLGNVPIFISVLKDLPPRRQRIVIIREMFIALVALLILLFFGQHLLHLLGLRTETVSITGGIILFIIAIKMLFPGTRGEYDDEFEGEPLVVPLAIPLVAGPSVLATLLLMVSREPDRLFDWTLALFLAWLASALILLASGLLQKLLGARGLVAVERLMGMLLVAMAVQMFLDGVRTYLGPGTPLPGP